MNVESSHPTSSATLSQQTKRPPPLPFTSPAVAHSANPSPPPPSLPVVAQGPHRGPRGCHVGSPGDAVLTCFSRGQLVLLLQHVSRSCIALLLLLM